MNFSFYLRFIICTALIAILLSGCKNRQIRLSEKVPDIDNTREVKILTAFFGLDKMPRLARLLYKKAPGKDGMPIVFSHEVDPSTLDASDIEVISNDGSVFQVEFVTLLPAEEEFELRTALLIGTLGEYPHNPPATVRIKDDLMTRTGVNYKGKTAPVVPLLEGPILSYAEHFTLDQDYPYLAEGDGCDCPREETTTVVKAVWAGGVRALNGEELGENEKRNFRVTLIDGSDTTVVTPFMLADLGDGDNNIDLCLKEPGTPVWLEVDANVAIDPRDDPNPNTAIEVVSRW